MTVEEKVRKVIADTLGIKEEKITPESSIIDYLGADSWIPLSLSWIWNENSGSKSRMKTRKNYGLFRILLTILENRPNKSSSRNPWGPLVKWALFFTILI